MRALIQITFHFLIPSLAFAYDWSGQSWRHRPDCSGNETKVYYRIYKPIGKKDVKPIPDDWALAVEDAVQKAANEWSYLIHPDAAFILQKAPWYRTTENRLIFADMGWTNEIANTIVYIANDNNDVIKRCITIFNTFYQWSTETPPLPNHFDVWNVAAHEFGHWLTLNNLSGPGDTEKTMYLIAQLEETKKRDLENDDVYGLCWIYPRMDCQVITNAIPQEWCDGWCGKFFEADLVFDWWSGGTAVYFARDFEFGSTFVDDSVSITFVRPGGSVRHFSHIYANSSPPCESYNVPFPSYGFGSDIFDRNLVGHYDVHVELWDVCGYYIESSQLSLVSYFRPWGRSSSQDRDYHSMDKVVLTTPIPRVTALHQNQPNPFNQLTAISYQLKTPGHTTLKIYDLTGRLVRTLVDGEKEAGYYTVTWDRKDDRGRELSNGVYFYRLQISQTPSENPPPSAPPLTKGVWGIFPRPGR